MATEHLLIKALKGGKVSRPPVWMMRQAGRYLPDFMALKEKYDFFTRVQTPELACEITLQPVDQIGVDAAILFSDILVVPQAMGLEVEMIENKGPFLPFTVNTKHEIDSLRVEGAAEKLEYVSKAITLTQKELDGRVPLIGFAGAPFTLLCYMVEGRSSKTFDKAKQFCFSRPDLAHELLSKITEVTLAYLEEQVKAGVDAIQVFDSWSGLLGPKEFNEFALPYLIRISDRISPKVPVILFPKGSGYALEELSRTSASAIGVDWCIQPEWARKLTGPKKTLQGNMDPCKLLLPIPRIRQEVKEMIDGFGCQHYIANLGHGILPNIPIENAKAFVEAVKNYTSSESL